MAEENVLVTGGAGFIGSHVVDRLVAGGARVIVLDDLSTGSLDNLRGVIRSGKVDVVEADVVEGLFGPLADLVKRYGSIARIVHLAAQVSVVRSVASPMSDLRVNCGGTVQVLEYARHAGVKKVVFASSCAVYGDTARMPLREDDPCAPLSPYGANKLASEHYLRYYASVHGVRSACFRFFNVFGPRQSPKSAYSGVISIFAMRALSGSPLLVFGDGEQTRDFVFVDDVARVVVDAARIDDGDGRAVNVGTGVATSVNALARSVIEASATGVAIEHAPARAGEARHALADVTRAEQLYGFRAQVALDEGIRQTVRWAKGAA